MRIKKFPWIEMMLIILLVITFINTCKNENINHHFYNHNQSSPAIEAINKKLDRLQRIYITEGRWPAGLQWPGDTE